jgi:hypothetical protein
VIERSREIALTLALSPTRERGHNAFAITAQKRMHFPLSRVRDRAGVKTSVVHRDGKTR